nr:loricrin-like [Procambarus clarkii]
MTGGGKDFLDDNIASSTDLKGGDELVRATRGFVRGAGSTFVAHVGGGGAGRGTGGGGGYRSSSGGGSGSFDSGSRTGGGSLTSATHLRSDGFGSGSQNGVGSFSSSSYSGGFSLDSDSHGGGGSFGSRRYSGGGSLDSGSQRRGGSSGSSSYSEVGSLISSSQSGGGSFSSISPIGSGNLGSSSYSEDGSNNSGDSSGPATTSDRDGGGGDEGGLTIGSDVEFGIRDPSSSSGGGGGGSVLSRTGASGGILYSSKTGANGRNTGVFINSVEGDNGSGFASSNGVGVASSNSGYSGQTAVSNFNRGLVGNSGRNTPFVGGIPNPNKGHVRDTSSSRLTSRVVGQGGGAALNTQIFRKANRGTKTIPSNHVVGGNSGAGSKGHGEASSREPRRSSEGNFVIGNKDGGGGFSGDNDGDYIGGGGGDNGGGYSRGGDSGGGGGGGYTGGGGASVGQHNNLGVVFTSGYLDVIPGTPGRDYLLLSTVPSTAFVCDSLPGYYADTDPAAGCQVFHICQANGRMDSFLCPNGTVFNQQFFVCDWWFNFDCSTARQYYDLNFEIGKVDTTTSYNGNTIPHGSYDHITDNIQYPFRDYRSPVK